MGESYSVEGRHNLAITEKADNFTQWMYSEIKPNLRGNILEIGSGIGTYSKKIVRDFKDSRIVLSDIDQDFVSRLSAAYRGNGQVSSLRIDLTLASDLKQIKHQVDSVFALNVLEHIEHDTRALENVYRLLPKGGRFVILVPAHMSLFNCIDTAVGHYRRYSKKELSEKAAAAGFRVMKSYYFNLPGIFGWYINGSLLKKKTLNEGAMGFYDRMIPLVKHAERIILRKAGLSIIMVLEK
ncbi:MAG: class I SAM-dependent methyltransferase [Candidatus Micrarchaeia archaeon]